MASRAVDERATAMARKPVLEMDTRRPNAWRVCGLDAAARGELAQCVRLAESGAWSAAHAVDKHGSTALMWAAGTPPPPPSACLCLSGCAGACSSSSGCFCTGGNHLEVVQWLLSAAVQPPLDPNVGNKEGRTALMCAPLPVSLPRCLSASLPLCPS